MDHGGSLPIEAGGHLLGGAERAERRGQRQHRHQGVLPSDRHSRLFGRGHLFLINTELFDDIGFAFRLTFMNKCDEVERPVIAEYYQRCFGKELPESGVVASLS